MFREAVEEYLKAAPLAGFTSDQIAALRGAFEKSGIDGYFQQRIEQFTKTGEYSPEHSDFQIAQLYARLGKKEQAFEWLEKAYAEHSDGMVRLKEELAFDHLRSDPRFAELVQRVGLPQ